MAPPNGKAPAPRETGVLQLTRGMTNGETIKDELPFFATIKKIDRYYTLT